MSTHCQQFSLHLTNIVSIIEIYILLGKRLNMQAILYSNRHCYFKTYEVHTLQYILPDSRQHSWYSSSLWREQTFPPTAALQPNFYPIIHPPPVHSNQESLLGLMHIQFANPIFTSNDLRPAQLSLYSECCGTTTSLCTCASYEPCRYAVPYNVLGCRAKNHQPLSPEGL